MKKNEINIIVPVYDTPLNDLKRAFDSIVSQEYQSWKVIIVDDGSSIECAKWLDEYVKSNKKFIVYHISNQGVSNARNFGISKATGEYIIFLDSDDALEKGFMSNGIKLMQKYGLDVICGGTKRIYSNKEIEYTSLKNDGIPWIYKGRKKLNLFAYMLTGQVSKKNKECNNILLARVFSKIYKTDAIKKMKFNTSVHMGEDNLFSFDVLLKCKSFGIVDDIWYKYYDNEYSVTNLRKITTDKIDYQYIFYNKMRKYENICKDYHLLDELNLRKIRILKNYIGDMAQYDGSVNYGLSKISKIKVNHVDYSKYRQKTSDKIFGFIFACSNDKIKFLMLYFIVYIIRFIRKIKMVF